MTHEPLAREVLPAQLRPEIAALLSIIAAASLVTALASCQAIAERHRFDNTIEEPRSMSPVHEPVPLLWSEYFSGGLDEHSWFVPAIWCVGHAAMVYQQPGWRCEALQ